MATHIFKNCQHLFKYPIIYFFGKSVHILTWNYKSIKIKKILGESAANTPLNFIQLEMTDTEAHE